MVMTITVNSWNSQIMGVWLRAVNVFFILITCLNELKAFSPTLRWLSQGIMESCVVIFLLIFLLLFTRFNELELAIRMKRHHSSIHLWDELINNNTANCKAGNAKYYHSVPK